MICFRFVGKLLLRWDIVEITLVIYSISILYAIGKGLRYRAAISTIDIGMYGIDKVSSYYGPGSWASWLFTTAACCLDRLFRKPEPYQAGKLSHRYFTGIDLNIIGVYSYPMVAGFDLLTRSKHYFQYPMMQVSCLAAPSTVLHVGTGLGILLTSICFRRWYLYGTELAAVFIGALATCTFILMYSVFDCWLLGCSPTDLALGFFLLPRLAHRTHRRNELIRLFQHSKHAQIVSYFGCLLAPTSIFDNSCVTDLGVVLYPVVGLAGLVRLFSKSRLSWRTPLLTLGVTIALYGADLCLFMLFMYLAYMFPVYFWLYPSPPLTSTSVLDLDQLSVLCLGGALVFISSGVRLIDNDSWVLEKLWALSRHVSLRLARLNRNLCGITRRQEIRVEADIPLPERWINSHRDGSRSTIQDQREFASRPRSSSPQLPSPTLPPRPLPVFRLPSLPNPSPTPTPHTSPQTPQPPLFSSQTHTPSPLQHFHLHPRPSSLRPISDGQSEAPAHRG
ncbi:hypothetical protein ONS95_015060 [Cadophora gregata]|uniref:uncharacterized protein n=1 Tax=Cadophora gregata TaxID=51156 RepID=UPI0026DB3BB8|nr:uncharacterized protein ONS95_015060 [Cadophora gregata]KAK0117535.1 hypothetical protein ONS95_015060 [Cadophora gregata]